MVSIAIIFIAMAYVIVIEYRGRPVPQEVPRPIRIEARPTVPRRLPWPNS